MSPRPEDDAEGSGLSDLDRGAAARRTERRQAAEHREPLHAGNERRHERRAAHAALHELDVEDLRRRPVGARRGARARRRARPATSSRDRPCSSTSKPQIGGGQASPTDPAVKIDGTPLTGGYISLQAETAPHRLSEGRAAESRGMHGSEGVELQELLRQVESCRCASRRPKLHSRWRRRSAINYVQYSRLSPLASPAPRPSRCHGHFHHGLLREITRDGRFVPFRARADHARGSDMPSLMRRGSARIGFHQSAYSSQCAVGVTDSSCALISGHR